MALQPHAAQVAFLLRLTMSCRRRRWRALRRPGAAAAQEGQGGRSHQACDGDASAAAEARRRRRWRARVVQKVGPFWLGAAWAERPSWRRHGWVITGFSDCFRGFGAALRTREEGPSASDATGRPSPSRQRHSLAPCRAQDASFAALGPLQEAACARPCNRPSDPRRGSRPPGPWRRRRRRAQPSSSAAAGVAGVAVVAVAPAARVRRRPQQQRRRRHRATPRRAAARRAAARRAAARRAAARRWRWPPPPPHRIASTRPPAWTWTWRGRSASCRCVCPSHLHALCAPSGCCFRPLRPCAVVAYAYMFLLPSRTRRVCFHPFPTLPSQLANSRSARWRPRAAAAPLRCFAPPTRRPGCAAPTHSRKSRPAPLRTWPLAASISPPRFASRAAEPLPPCCSKAAPACGHVTSVGANGMVRKSSPSSAPHMAPPQGRSCPLPCRLHNGHTRLLLTVAAHQRAGANAAALSPAQLTCLVAIVDRLVPERRDGESGDGFDAAPPSPPPPPPPPPTDNAVAPPFIAAGVALPANVALPPATNEPQSRRRTPFARDTEGGAVRLNLAKSKASR